MRRASSHVFKQHKTVHTEENLFKKNLHPSDLSFAARFSCAFSVIMYRGRKSISRSFSQCPLRSKCCYHDVYACVLAKEETPTQKILLRHEDSRDSLEVCPQSLILVKGIATRLEEDGSPAPIADYGHNGEGTDTFRAFKDHKQHDPVVDPGTADLTADVDFSALKKAVEERKVLSFGPVTKRDFLLKMGIKQMKNN